MVGDNFEVDITAAAGLGMSTCWLAPPERAQPAGPRPTARITSLPEIERILAYGARPDSRRWGRLAARSCWGFASQASSGGSGTAAADAFACILTVAWLQH